MKLQSTNHSINEPFALYTLLENSSQLKLIDQMYCTFFPSSNTGFCLSNFNKVTQTNLDLDY